ncbi:MAG: hypothetical protein NXI01_04755 [Gammaproteobacteria bacterium]|nr:hypothetical protein [Gammaproteobacteria bacterium]
MKCINAALLLSLAILASNGFAATGTCNYGDVVIESEDCLNTFDISIYNNSSYNCDLASQTVVYGDLHSNNRVPAYLAPGSHQNFQMVETDRGASIRLTYVCEDHHQITLLSHSNLRPGFLRSTNHMKGTVENSENMVGFVTKSFNGFRENSKIDWILERAE